MQRLTTAWRGSLRNKVVIVAVPLALLCSVCCVCGALASVLPGGQAASAPTDLPAPTRTPGATATTTIARANTAVPAETPRPAATSGATSAPVATGPAYKFDDAGIAAVVQSVLPAAGVDVVSVQVADGRAKGGPRTMIVSVKVDGYNTTKYYQSIAAVAGAFYSANKSAQTPIDELSVVVGNSAGAAIAVVNISAADVRAVSEGTITTPEFVNRWKVTRF